MKRVIVITIAVVLICSNAIADIGGIVEDYNRCCIIAGAAQLTGEPEKDGNTYTYNAGDHVKVIFETDNDDLKTFACICFDESGVSEFLAQCVTAFYDIGDLPAYLECFDPVLSDFLKARTGEQPGSNKSVPGILFEISKESFGYIFMLVKVE